MRPTRFLICVIICACLLASAAARELRIQARQDEDGASTTFATTAISTSSALIKRQSSSAKTTDATARGSSSNASPTTQSVEIISSTAASDSASGSPSSATIAALTSLVLASASATSTAANTAQSLPIQPKLTPAIGVAGVIMIISGLAYGLWGVRSKWLYIYLSMAFAVSTSITLLVVACMKPPVTNAVQGAFLVAIVLSGALLGGLAFLFNEIVDGICCLVGGFAFSMWFLTMKPGGLIESKTGKAVFVTVICVITFSVSWVRLAKAYVTVGCVAFASATMIILGIDCFSGAGLKEFWLYIWDLNSDIFPLGTNTYPITGGMIGEIAMVFLIALFSALNQWKQWMIVSRNRKEKKDERHQHERHLSQLEAALGRTLEDSMARERMQWEAQYGDQVASSKDSCISSQSSQKKSASVSVQEIQTPISHEDVEMNPIKRSNVDRLAQDRHKAVNRYRGAAPQEDDIRHIDQQGQLMPTPPRSWTKVDSHQSSPVEKLPVHPALRKQQSVESRRSSKRNSHVPPPLALPRPVHLPRSDESAGEDEESPSESLSNSPSVRYSINRRRSTGRRLSGMRNSFRSSTRSSEFLVTPVNPTGSHSREALISMIEDDRVSSVAATLDDQDADLDSLPAWSRPVSLVRDEELPSASIKASTTTNHRGIKSQESGLATEDDDIETVGKGYSLHNQDDGVEVKCNRERAGSEDTAVETDVKDEAQNKDDQGSKDSIGGSTAADGDVGEKTEDKSQRRQPGGQRDEGQSQGGSASSTKPPSDSSAASGLEERLVAKLPEKPSKVAQIFRTNEWAKHAAVAEKPELDNLEFADPGSPGVEIHTGFMERAAPVNVEDLQRSAVEPALSNRRSTEMNRTSMDQKRQSQLPMRILVPQRGSLDGSAEGPSPIPSPYRQKTLRFADGQQTLAGEDITRHIRTRSPSNASGRAPQTVVGAGTLTRPPSFSRRSQINLSETIVEQPLLEEATEDASSEGMAQTQAAVTRQGSILLDQRGNMVRKRVSSAGLMAAPRSSKISVLPGDSTTARHFSHHEPVDPDQMSLSDRRAHLQRQTALHALQRPPSMASLNRAGGPSPTGHVNPGQLGDPSGQGAFDSHQPQRERMFNAMEQADRYAKWRESTNHLPKTMAPISNTLDPWDRYAKWRQGTQEMLGPGAVPVADESRRVAMLNAQRQRGLMEQVKEDERRMRESMMDQMMRRGDMLDLHREHLRKLQARANANAAAN